MIKYHVLIILLMGMIQQYGQASIVSTTDRSYFCYHNTINMCHQLQNTFSFCFAFDVSTDIILEVSKYIPGENSWKGHWSTWWYRDYRDIHNGILLDFAEDWMCTQFESGAQTWRVVITDRSRNGLCCTIPGRNGYFDLLVDGEKIYSASVFTREAEHTFTVEPRCASTAEMRFQMSDHVRVSDYQISVWGVFDWWTQYSGDQENIIRGFDESRIFCTEGSFESAVIVRETWNHNKDSSEWVFSEDFETDFNFSIGNASFTLPSPVPNGYSMKFNLTKIDEEQYALDTVECHVLEIVFTEAEPNLGILAWFLELRDRENHMFGNEMGWVQGFGSDFNKGGQVPYPLNRKLWFCNDDLAINWNVQMDYSNQLAQTLAGNGFYPAYSLSWDGVEFFPVPEYDDRWNFQVQIVDGVFSDISADCTVLEIKFVPDGYMEEVRWQLLAATDLNPNYHHTAAQDSQFSFGKEMLKLSPAERGRIQMSSGVGVNIVNTTAFVCQGVYIFLISDDYGDGICCEYGHGHVYMVNEREILVNITGEFGSGAYVTINVDHQGTATVWEHELLTEPISFRTSSSSFSLSENEWLYVPLAGFMVIMVMLSILALEYRIKEIKYNRLARTIKPGEVLVPIRDD